MTTTIFVFVLFVAFVIAAAYFQISVRKDLKSCAVTRPVGTVATYTYTGKSGRLSEPFSNMGMEEHINLLITNGLGGCEPNWASGSCSSRQDSHRSGAYRRTQSFGRWKPHC